MKLKEIPGSWWTALRLRCMSLAELHSTRSGQLPVIVTFTSIPSRLNVIHLTVRSLLAQELKPQKIVLWLNHSLRNQIPKALNDLQGDLFEIRFEALESSHRKLIFSLEAFPNQILVTCDDDLMYNPSWLARLYAEHLHHPRDVIAHECRLIRFDADGKPLPYNEWKTESRCGVTEPWLLPIGYGGVLYPPHALAPEVQDRELFMRLTPRADDLWFKAMAYVAGTQARRSSNPGEKPRPIIGSQKFSLQKTNVRKDGNYQQWLALCEHFGFDGQ